MLSSEKCRQQTAFCFATLKTDDDFLLGFEAMLSHEALKMLTGMSSNEQAAQKTVHFSLDLDEHELAMLC